MPTIEERVKTLEEKIKDLDTRHGRVGHRVDELDGARAVIQGQIQNLLSRVRRLESLMNIEHPL